MILLFTRKKKKGLKTLMQNVSAKLSAIQTGTKSDSLVVVLASRSGSLGGDMDPIIQDSLTMLESFCS